MCRKESVSIVARRIATNGTSTSEWIIEHIQTVDTMRTGTEGFSVLRCVVSGSGEVRLNRTGIRVILLQQTRVLG